MTPQLVEKALAEAARTGFTRSCSAETGRLLQVLAGARGLERVAEIGTGCGVGAAWILSALDPAVAFFTVELDESARLPPPSCSPAIRPPPCSTATGRSRSPRRRRSTCSSPTAAGRSTAKSSSACSRRAGSLVLDDLTPGYGDPDPVRELWLAHPRLVAVELQVSSREAVIVGTLQPR